jgi:outer membrane protein assembly factor BamB
MTSEWGRRAAAITAVTVCMGFGAAPASAQLFPPPDPPDPGASGPSTTQLSPAGESFAFGANPSRTGESLENRLGGPMFRDWTRRFGSLTAQPLVVGGRVIVATGQADGGGSRVLALTARSGKTLWEQRWAQSGVDAPMAATDGIVLTIDTTAAVRAFSAESGELLWARDLGDSAAYGMSPTALDGRFYVHSNRGLAALRAADGQLIWQRSVSPSPAGIAADEKRLYIAGPCGEGAALSRSTGATMWYRTGGCSGGGGYNAIVADGRMFSTEGYTYDAITGQPRGRLRQLPAVVGNGAAFIYNNGLQAAELSDGTVRWTKRIAPLNGRVLASGTVFVNTEESVVGVDQATGAVLSKTKTGIEYPSDSYYYDGLAAGAGRLFLSFDGKLTALRPYLNPAANSGALFTQRIAVRVGKRMGLTGLVGTALKRRGLKVELLGGPAGRKGKLKRLDTAATRSDGSAKFKIKLKRNMRVSVQGRQGVAAGQRLRVPGLPHPDEGCLTNPRRVHGEAQGRARRLRGQAQGRCLHRPREAGSHGAPGLRRAEAHRRKDLGGEGRLQAPPEGRAHRLHLRLRAGPRQGRLGCAGQGAAQLWRQTHPVREAEQAVGARAGERPRGAVLWRMPRRRS